MYLRQDWPASMSGEEKSAVSWRIFLLSATSDRIVYSAPDTHQYLHCSLGPIVHTPICVYNGQTITRWSNPLIMKRGNTFLVRLEIHIQEVDSVVERPALSAL